MIKCNSLLMQLCLSGWNRLHFRHCLCIIRDKRHYAIFFARCQTKINRQGDWPVGPSVTICFCTVTLNFKESKVLLLQPTSVPHLMTQTMAVFKTWQTHSILTRVTASDNVTAECNQSSCSWYPFMVYMPLPLMQNVTTLKSWHWYHFRLHMLLTLMQNITTECSQTVAL